MARADLLCELIKHGLNKNELGFRKTAEAICAEERSKQHVVLANKIDEILKNYPLNQPNVSRINMPSINSFNSVPTQLFTEKLPTKRLEHLQLPENIMKICHDIIEEQNRADLLRSYGLEPRNKILLIGPPGNGKTSLAEGIAESLMVPLINVRYDSIIGAY